MKERKQVDYKTPKTYKISMEKLYVNEVHPDGEVSTVGCTIPERS